MLTPAVRLAILTVLCLQLSGLKIQTIPVVFHEPLRFWRETSRGLLISPACHQRQRERVSPLGTGLFRCEHLAHVSTDAHRLKLAYNRSLANRKRPDP